MGEFGEMVGHKTNIHKSMAFTSICVDAFKKTIEYNKYWGGCGEIGSLCIAGGTAKWYRHCGKWCDDSSKN